LRFTADIFSKLCTSPVWEEDVLKFPSGVSLRAFSYSAGADLKTFNTSAKTMTTRLLYNCALMRLVNISKATALFGKIW